MPDNSLCRAAAPRLHPLQLLLAACVCFSCCSLLASASAAARRLCPLQLLLSIVCVSTAPRLRPLQLLLPDCVLFNCSSPIASASTAAPRQLFWKIPARAQCSQTFFAELEVQQIEVRRSRVTSLVPPHFRYTHTHRDKHMVKILMY